MKFFNCGNVQRSNDAYKYRVGNLPDITENIIPLFKKSPILGEKSKDFSDFCKVLEMIKANKHLTKEGLEEIRRSWNEYWKIKKLASGGVGRSNFV